MTLIPSNLTAEYVAAAFTALRVSGIPAGAQSTKFDVIDPVTDTPYPPKLVLAMACELATGTPLSRRNFTGGEFTNAPLRRLGFTIVPKNTAEIPVLDDVEVGVSLTNDQLTAAFAVGNSGGMRWSRKHQCLVIIADHTKGLYDDRWEDDVLLYTGMGRLGDQALTGQNLRVAEQQSLGTRIHLFEVFIKNAYVYAGTVHLAGAVGEEQQVDDEGVSRRVYVFPLRVESAAVGALPSDQAISQLTKSRRRSLQSKSIEQLRTLAERGGRQRPGRRNVITAQFQRSEAVSELARRLAGGQCDLCALPAPFATADGPYLECHHVHRLADGGADTIDNAVALCPNCHRRMHLLGSDGDTAQLRRRITERQAADLSAAA